MEHLFFFHLPLFESAYLMISINQKSKYNEKFYTKKKKFLKKKNFFFLTKIFGRFPHALKYIIFKVVSLNSSNSSSRKLQVYDLLLFSLKQGS